MDTRIVELLEACYGEELSLICGDLGALEQRVMVLMREWGRDLLQRMVARDPQGYQGSGRPCSCGGWKRFVGYRVKNIHTTVGWIEIRRAYYHCAACGTGECPYDRASGLGSESLSVGLAKAGCTLAVGNSFRASARIIEELFGQKVSPKTLERVVHHVGSVLIEQQRQRLEEFRQDRQLPVCDQPPQRLCLAPDGTTVHERDGWHESKIGCLSWEDPQRGRQQY